LPENQNYSLAPAYGNKRNIAKIKSYPDDYRDFVSLARVFVPFAIRIYLAFVCPTQ